ncbi:MAG: sigma-70 family RNA polymerase sigma factor [Planctomycetota bacterium]
MDRTARVADEWLVLAAQDRNPAAIDRLVEVWHGRLWRHARNVTGSNEGADDVSQDAWVGILKKLPTLDDPAAFPSWAYRIVTRRSTDWVRREVRHRRRRGPMPDDVSAPSPGPTERETRERAQRVLDALQHLSVDQRALISMHYLNDLSTTQIADALRIPRGTVKSRLHRARQNLKPHLQGVES